MKREREIKDLVRKAGLQLVSISHTGGNHLKAVCRRDDGLTFMTFHSLTPSDVKSGQAMLSQLSRYARGTDNPRRHG